MPYFKNIACSSAFKYVSLLEAASGTSSGGYWSSGTEQEQKNMLYTLKLKFINSQDF